MPHIPRNLFGASFGIAGLAGTMLTLAAVRGPGRDHAGAAGRGGIAPHAPLLGAVVVAMTVVHGSWFVGQLQRWIRASLPSTAAVEAPRA